MDPEKVNYHYCDDLPTAPLPPGTRILVTGANGYVARRLIPELVHRGYVVRCMYRNDRTHSLLEHPRIEAAFADCLKKDQLLAAMRDVTMAYYLVHSMRGKKDKFAETDRLAAKNFAEAAAECGVKRIVYLGGLGEVGSDLSPHLRSRMEVGETLSAGSVPVISLRAAIILGTGSASYELLKSLVMHNRWIPFMSKFNSRCQPIAIRDVIKYLVGVMETENLRTRVFMIGGGDVLSYKNLILRFAGLLNRKVHMFDISGIPIPSGLLCRIYAYWLHLFVSVPVNIISLLLDSLKVDVVCRERKIRTILPFAPLGFDEAVRRALDKENKSEVFSHWADVPPARMLDLMPLCEYESSEFIVEEHSIDIPAAADKVFQSVMRIGGKNGWFYGNLLWRLRGFIDRILGGVGLQRGRRDPAHLRVGDSLDFWRVEKLDRNKELLLRAEMISPGLSWLQFLLTPVSPTTTRLTLKAHFIPYPVWGHLYWHLLSIIHTRIFTGMLAHFRREAAMQGQESPKAAA